MSIEKDFAFAESLDEKRVFDRIVLVTDDLEKTTGDLCGTFGYPDFDKAETSMGERASMKVASGIELFILQPKDEDSLYGCSLKKYGKGILGVRERISEKTAELWKKHIEDCQISLFEDEEGCKWMDLTDSLGFYWGLHVCEEEIEPADSEKHIGQICITVENCEKACADMLHFLGKGPWEIGFMNNQTTKYFCSSEYDREQFPEGEMKIGMGWFANLEFEIIEPTKGPMPYFKFLKRHGNGFHHIKERIASEKWEETLKHYADSGVKTALGGQIGPCEFCNLDTEELFGCVYELGDDHILDGLPEGYNAYMYPSAK